MTRQETVIAKKRRGPKPTGKGTPVVTRLQPPELSALDAWIAKSDDPKMSRPEAIRRLLAEKISKKEGGE